MRITGFRRFSADGVVAKTNFQSVDEYIGSHPEPVRAVLTRVREVLRKALPEAEEGISYQIAAYKQNGSAILYFAGWKEHFSIYPASDALVAAIPELKDYKVSKGTVRFSLSKPVPAKLIAAIAKFRLREETARMKSKVSR